jgi:hypothetical protein
MRCKAQGTEAEEAVKMSESLWSFLNEASITLAEGRLQGYWKQ